MRWQEDGKLVHNSVLRHRAGCNGRGPGLGLCRPYFGATLLAAAVLSATPFVAGAADGAETPPLSQMVTGNACTATAMSAQLACKAAVESAYWTTIGRCANFANAKARRGCLDDAAPERSKDRDACGARFDVRLDLCAALGEAAYDPTFEAAGFVDPQQIGITVTPNPLFPLQPGREWIYWSVGETITVAVTSRTRQIGDAACLAVNSRVENEDGSVIEETDDWYAQDLHGTVWSCGMTARAAAGQAGDEGSWTAFRRFAKPGIIMAATPRPGDVYRREFVLGEAEDATQVLSVTGSAEVPGASCTDDCLVTSNFSPLTPGVTLHRYYAPGIGLILEVDPDTGRRRELVSMTPAAATSE